MAISKTSICGVALVGTNLFSFYIGLQYCGSNLGFQSWEIGTFLNTSAGLSAFPKQVPTTSTAVVAPESSKARAAPVIGSSSTAVPTLAPKPKVSTELKATFQTSVSIPNPNWLPSVQSRPDSVMIPAESLSQWEERTNNWMAKFPCHPGSTDCESYDALRGALWGMTNGVTFEAGALRCGKETQPFQELHGFRRILIESDASLREENIRNCPSALNIVAALCSPGTSLHYMHSHPHKELQGIAEFMPMDELERHYAKVATAFKKAEKDWSKVEWTPDLVERGYDVVECFPLSDLAQKLDIHTIDFMILDVEGAELNVLKTSDWSKLRINVLVTECSDDPRKKSQRCEELKSYMLSEAAGGAYELLFPGQVGRNLWFKRKDFTLHSAPDWSRESSCADKPELCR